MDDYQKKYFKTEKWKLYKREWTRQKRAELKLELQGRPDELHNLRTLRAELKQMRLEMKIKEDIRTIFLMDGEMIIGCYSPNYSRMLFHPASDNGREMAMRKFI